jgi:hypothetical protein
MTRAERARTTSPRMRRRRKPLPKSACASVRTVAACVAGRVSCMPFMLCVVVAEQLTVCVTCMMLVRAAKAYVSKLRAVEAEVDDDEDDDDQGNINNRDSRVSEHLKQEMVRLTSMPPNPNLRP